MTDYTKLTAQEAIELARKDHEVIFVDRAKHIITGIDAHEHWMIEPLEPFSAHKLVPYGEVKE